MERYRYINILDPDGLQQKDKLWHPDAGLIYRERPDPTKFTGADILAEAMRFVYFVNVATRDQFEMELVNEKKEKIWISQL